MALNKIKQCFLHIGSSKTGTSSIQSELFRNRRHLRRVGYFYPNNAANHIFLATRFREDPTEIAFHRKNGRETKELISNYIEQEMSQFENDLNNFKGDSLIISSEYLPPTSADSCKELAEYLHRFCEKVTVICYLRHPLSHAISAAQQSVKMGFSTIESVQKAAFFFKPQKILPKFIEAFGRANIIVRPFDKKQMVNNDVVMDFLSLIGLSDDEILGKQKKGKSNSSLSYEATLIADALTKELPRTIDGIWNLKRAKRVNLMKIPGSKFNLSKAAIERTREAAKPEMEYLLTEFGIQLEEPQEAIMNEPQANWDDKTIKGLARKFNSIALEAQHMEALAFFYRGKNAELLGDKELAIMMFRKAVNLKPQEWEIVEGLYILLSETGSLTEAKEHLARYTHLFPQDARVKALEKGQEALHRQSIAS